MKLEKSYEQEHKLIYETIADIAFLAGMMLSENEIKIGDSRELIWNVIEWAIGFEKKYKDNEWIDEDYMEKIHAFADRKLIMTYGKEVPNSTAAKYIGRKL